MGRDTVAAGTASLADWLGAGQQHVVCLPFAGPGLFAATATPVFPGFFVLLASVLGQAAVAPINAFAVLLIWLLWSWSGARLLQGMIAGEAVHHGAGAGADSHRDLSGALTWVYGLGFAILAGLGLVLGGLLI